MKRFFAMLVVMASAVPAMAGSDNPLVGRWDHPTKDHYYIRFFGNGVFRQVTAAGMHEGRYRLLDANVVEFNFVVRQGRMNRRLTNEIKYRFGKEGNLELKLEGKWCSFMRSASEN